MLAVRALVGILAAAVVCSSSCPPLNTTNIGFYEVSANKPIYVLFFPRNEDSYNLDNVCFTFFPVPDDSTTYVSYISRVFDDGSNIVKSFIFSESQIGILMFGSAVCQFKDAVFAQLNCATNAYLAHRCESSGTCPAFHLLASPSAVFGFSEVERPLSTDCLNQAAAIVESNGLPKDDYIILPMKLPSQCVLRQVCTVSSRRKKFFRSLSRSSASQKQ